MPAFLSAECRVKPRAGGSAFISERDGEPFVIRYGVGISQAKGDAKPIIACEKKGKDGTRYVAFANGDVDCVDEVAARELMQGNL